jgi:hypothetical protein
MVPSDARLQGFDISPTHFPAPGFLPKNLSMHVWDAFSELSAELVGAFDVVHIRAITSAVKDNHVEPLMKNLVKMLSMPRLHAESRGKARPS